MTPNHDKAKEWANQTLARNQTMPTSMPDAWDNLAQCYLELVKKLEVAKSALELMIREFEECHTEDCETQFDDDAECNCLSRNPIKRAREALAEIGKGSGV